MSRIATFFREKKRVRENLNEIKKDRQDAFDHYDPFCRYYADCLAKEPVEKIVMYEAEKSEGRFLALHALFEAFMQREDFASYKHVWILHRKKECRLLKEKYGEYENVEIMRIKEEAPMKYYKFLATASYLFQGANFPYPFTKRSGQFVMSVRDFEKAGPVVYEDGGDFFHAANHIRNVLMADAVLVPGESDYLRLKKAFRLEGIFEGNVLIADAVSQGKEILETVLEQTPRVKMESDFRTEKKKLLFYGAGMPVNGVTETLLALLHEIDYERYDVTVFCYLKDGIYSRRNLNRIDKRARVLLIRGADPMTEEEQLWILYLKKYGLCGEAEEKAYEKYRYLFRRCAVRRLGITSFDDIIDFSGYSIWIPLLLLEVPAKKRLIWEHCDLKEDFAVVNGGRLKHGDVTLEGLLSVYRRFDRIVAVNRPLMELNRRKIGEEATRERFGYATNLLDKSRLEEKISRAEMDSIQTDADGKRYLVYDSGNTSVDGTIKMLPFGKEDGAFYFVTVGRLSQEKNHENLILAFREFLKEYPQSRLFIVGKGGRLNLLQALTAKNGLEKNVIFTGSLSNPYLLMKHCDCFVFPSYAEGQGLVVLEARMLGMPIVISRYDVCEAVCVEGGQFMTGMEKEEILEGLLAYAHGEVPTGYHFDIDEYNQKAIEEFYHVIED